MIIVGRQTYIESSINECQRALERYREKHWRCEARDPSGRWRCQNYWEGHDKGHQFTCSDRPSTQANMLRVGEFKCSFEPKSTLDSLYHEIKQILRSGQAIEKLSLTAQASGVSSISSNRTCFSCLSNSPSYILPCVPLQHSICEECLKRFDTSGQHVGSTASLNHCPLTCRFAFFPWSIRLKPRAAGVRVLKLDG